MHLETHSKQAAIGSARLEATRGDRLYADSLGGFQFLPIQFEHIIDTEPGLKLSRRSRTGTRSWEERTL